MMTSRRWWVVGPGGDCIMPRQAWETQASARKVAASRFERGSKGSRGPGAEGLAWERLGAAAPRPGPAATATTGSVPGRVKAGGGVCSLQGEGGRWHLQIPQLPGPEGCSGRALLTVAVFINRFSTAA